MIEQRVFSSRVKTFIDYYRLSFHFCLKERVLRVKGDRQTNISWAKRRARENKEFLCTWLRIFVILEKIRQFRPRLRKWTEVGLVKYLEKSQEMRRGGGIKTDNEGERSC